MRGDGIRTGSGRAGSGHVICGRECLLLGDDVVLLSLRGEFPFGFVAVALALAVLLVGVLYRDLLAQQILSAHRVPGNIASLEAVKADEAVPLADVVVVTNDVRLSQDLAKLAESVVEDLLIHRLVEVVDEQLGTDVERLLLVGRRLVDADWLSPDADSIQHFRGIVGGPRRIEFDEPVALVCL